MSDIRFRDAAAADAEALAEAARETFVVTFGHTYRPEDLNAFVRASYSPAQSLAEILDPARATRLALDPMGAIAGFAQTGPLRLPIAPGPGRAWEIYRLYVQPPWQGRGVADALMDWALAEAQARFATEVYLGVWAENFRAQRFYARYGFAKVGAYQFPVGAALDDEDILMRAL